MMYSASVLFVIFSVIVISYGSDCKIYQVFEIYATPEEKNLIRCTFADTKGYDFWSLNNISDRPIQVKVAPTSVYEFTTFLRNHCIKYTMKNLCAYLSQKRRRLGNPGRNLRGYRRTSEMLFDKFERYSAMVQYMVNLHKKHPDRVKLLNMGSTSENRKIIGLKISSPGKNKPIIFIDGGIHGREWLSPAAVLYIIQQLVENREHYALTKHVDWYIFPTINPDGYEYTFTDKMWRKNRAPTSNKNCKGVDLNRNFDVEWNKIGSSNNPCSEIYSGTQAFSELESKHFRDFIFEINKCNNIKLYLTFHSFGATLLHPFGYSKRLPDNYKELHDLGNTVRNAIYSYRNTTYKVGSPAGILYPSSGGSDDWMKFQGVPLVYTVELPGNRFDVPTSEIKPVVIETFKGVIAFAEYVQKVNGQV